MRVTIEIENPQKYHTLHIDSFGISDVTIPFSSMSPTLSTDEATFAVKPGAMAVATINVTDWRVSNLTVIEDAVAELAEFQITTGIYKAFSEGNAQLDVEYMAKDDHDMTYLYYCNFVVPYNDDDDTEYFVCDMLGDGDSQWHRQRCQGEEKLTLRTDSLGEIVLDSVKTKFEVNRFCIRNELSETLKPSTGSWADGQCECDDDDASLQYTKLALSMQPNDYPVVILSSNADCDSFENVVSDALHFYKLSITTCPRSSANNAIVSIFIKGKFSCSLQKRLWKTF